MTDKLLNIYAWLQEFKTKASESDFAICEFAFRNFPRQSLEK